MSIDANSGSFITVNEAKDYVRDFRHKYPNEIKGAFVGIDVLSQLLKEDVMGLRIYNGYDEANNKMNYVLVGVDQDGKDITTLIVERLKPCPSFCDSSSPLY